MAAVATGTNARLPGAYTASSGGANTLPRQGLAHLVSKFETLDKANVAPRRKPSTPRQPGAGLTASKTMSSLSSLQDNQGYFDKPPYRRDVRSDAPATSSPVAVAAAALTRTNISPGKPDVAPPSKANSKDRLSTVAEKRKIFEADKSASKDNLGSHATNTKTSKTSANFLPPENPDKKLSTSQSCGHIYSTPITAPNSPLKSNLGVSLQNSHPYHRERLQNSSMHSVPALSLVLRVHRDTESHDFLRDDKLRPSSKVDGSKQSSPRITHVSSAGSPLKSPSKLGIKTVRMASRDSSPISSPTKAAAYLLPSSLPHSTLSEMKRHSASSITPTTSVESVDSIVIAKRGQSVPQLTKNWSPQRIVTPQKPTTPQKTAPIQPAAGYGTFVKPKRLETFRDALGFFEAMSHKDSPHSGISAKTAKRPSDEPQAANPNSKREKLKGSLKKISSSWRFKRARNTGETSEKLTEYPAMWKLGSIEAAPRKRLHAEWCEVSEDHRQPLRASKTGEISIFDPYLSSHAKVYRDGAHVHGHMDILLQETSLHNNFCVASESDYGANNVATDCSRSPVGDAPRVLKPRRRPSRRWFSRSSGTLISQAHCRLEQPRPVHGVEMKRLISLCKIRGSVKRRGHSE